MSSFTFEEAAQLAAGLSLAILSLRLLYQAMAEPVQSIKLHVTKWCLLVALTAHTYLVWRDHGSRVDTWTTASTERPLEFNLHEKLLHETKKNMINAKEQFIPIDYRFSATATISALIAIVIVCFLLLTVIASVATCCENRCLGAYLCCKTIMALTTFNSRSFAATFVASLWSALLVFDIGLHVADNVSLLQSHYIADMLVVLLMWFFVQMLIRAKRTFGSTSSF